MSSESGERRPARSRGVEAEAETENFPCPRCNSTNTKFCYYNNYNLCQPRYFCKSCRRYWTRGGALRNIPVGGGTRKPSSSSKRSRISAAAVNSSALSPENSGPAPEGPEPMGNGPGCEVNLNEAVPEPETGSLGGGVEFAQLGEFGLGLEPSGLHDGFELGLGLGLCDWPTQSVGGGAANINGGVAAATRWNDDGAWQIGERPLSDGGDCFGFPELAISAPGRKS